MIYPTILAIIAIIAAIWVIYDVLVNNKRLSNGMKMLWIIFAICFSIITAVIYYLISRDSNDDLFNRKITRRNKR
ncbi:MAG: PLDc N-terminal domain-containing protein [archaeon]|jgi:ATP/ADP translocase